MSVDELEELVAGGEGVYELDEASYPPCCTPPSGRLQLTRLPRGELKIEVDKRRIRDADCFQLDVLFSNGVCIFGDTAYFGGFLRGPIAEAFGIEIEPHPKPVRHVQTMVEDLRPKIRKQKAKDDEEEATPAPRSSRRPPSPRPAELARALAKRVSGQDAAVARVAELVAGQLAKVAPARPESMLLLGPHGAGKTRAVAALPDALADVGHESAHVFRVDCGLAGGFDASRLLGSAPGYVGYTESPPLLEALEQRGCILLLDEIEKAHFRAHQVLLGLVDEGRLSAPDGRSIDVPGLVVAMTSADGADDLEHALAEVPPGSREEIDVCRTHLYRQGWPDELIGRIGSFVVFDPPPLTSLHEAAESAIRALGREYGLEVESLPPVLADVVTDLADTDEAGLRAVTHAARDLLMRAFAEAAREGLEGAVAIDPGPPPKVEALQRSLL
jgi:ATP-dependent Clp protease ATP-binding subunit ClpA